MYRRNDAAPDSEEAKQFRSTYSREATITFIGVWDTVGSLGIPVRGLSKLTARRHEFHDVELTSYVKHGCHALAIDENQGPFQPSLWQAQPKPGQIVEQVWFSGVHSDVGGTSDPKFGKPAFTWMKERASYAGLVLSETLAAPARANEPVGPLALVITWLRELWTGICRRVSNTNVGTWLFGLLSQPRHIGGDGTQSVHPSARDRYVNDPSGSPTNLAHYLASPKARIY